MWNERYAAKEYVYGTEPNAFLVEHAHLLSGPVLSLAEGEGRNAVYLASLSLDVLGVDGSAVGLAKAQKLASARGVAIRTTVVDLADYVPPENSFGAVVSISAHLPTAIRKRLHRLVALSLKPGGILLLEAYAKAQITRNTGGPRDVDMLMSSVELETEFPGCEPFLSREIERDVIEGKFHTGTALVVQLLARKIT
jgi:cyclopropane fatty-acyl-phospholipid synthase-like methyltransferase